MISLQIHAAEDVTGQPPSRLSYAQYSTVQQTATAAPPQINGQGQQAGTNAGERAAAVLASSSSSSSASHRKLAYDPST